MTQATPRFLLLWSAIAAGLLAACASSAGVTSRPAAEEGNRGGPATIQQRAGPCRPGMPGWPCANAACTLCCCEDGVDLRVPRAECCPQGDQDADGILDRQDRCAGEPEDRDGFEDDDGCPDPDNDGDKILDTDDLCPGVPEDVDGHEDRDGCPDPSVDRSKGTEQ